MSNIIPFNSPDGNLPALPNRQRLGVNKDIVLTAPFPTLSIKGKVFTLVQDSERKILTKPDDPDEVVQSVNGVFLRINMKSKTFYKKKFSEEEGEQQRPDCYSHDGVTPSINATDKQAETCAVCKHNVFGSATADDGTVRKGKRCGDHARIAVADPRHLDKPMLLRVPPASLKPLKDAALKPVKARGYDYNEVVFRVGFEKEAASPVLTFKPVGILDDTSYEKVKEMFDSEVVRSIVGLDEVEFRDALPAPETGEAAPAPTPKPEPAPTPSPTPAPAKAKAVVKPAKAAAPTPAPTPAPAVAAGDDDLLGDLDSLLGASDD